MNIVVLLTGVFGGLACALFAAFLGYGFLVSFLAYAIGGALILLLSAILSVYVKPRPSRTYTPKPTTVPARGG